MIYRLYRHSPFLHEGQLGNMLRDYRDQLRQILPLLPAKGRLLEIGCANGFFLEAALQLGFDDVRGVEPSADAVRKAHPHIRPKIINAVFNPDLFPKSSFDIVCCFQVLDHLLDPKAVLHGAHALLREGGILLLINHNIRSWMPRLLGEGCPMYDIEHIYLFDRKTAAQLLEATGYEVVRVANISNSYMLSYAIKMLPLPGLLKRSLIALGERTGLDSWRIRLPAGNMVSIGRKRSQMPLSLRSPPPVFVKNAVGCV
jgi:2-polyprenyl-3-methyl-5-hydroxy-6-metoxy-1,4-benzoquinol methylase